MLLLDCFKGKGSLEQAFVLALFVPLLILAFAFHGLGGMASFRLWTPERQLASRLVLALFVMLSFTSVWRCALNTRYAAVGWGARLLASFVLVAFVISTVAGLA